MTAVAFRKLDGANETVKKGSPMDVKVVMIRLQRYALALLTVFHVRKSVRIMKGVKGNQQKNVNNTAKRSGVVVNALVVPPVDHARESVRIRSTILRREVGWLSMHWWYLLWIMQGRVSE